MHKELERILQNAPPLPADNLVVWGAGNTSRLYDVSLSYEGIDPICYLDNSPAAQQSEFNGKKVYSPDFLKKNKDSFVLISSTEPATIRAISAELQALGARFCSMDAYILLKNAALIRKVCSLLRNEESVENYSALMVSRITGEYPQDKYIQPVQNRYCGPFRFQLPDFDDCVVDLGAYCGDTLEKFLLYHDGMLKKYFLFEPLEKTFQACRKRVERLQAEWALDNDTLVCLQYAVGKTDCEQAMFDAGDTAVGGRLQRGCEVHPDNGGFLVRQTSLDSFFPEISEQRPKVTFIKADIEGGEYDMLLGARTLITRDKPRLAISLYHNPSDMYRIPLLLHSFVPEYTFEFFHYSYKWGDSILYAY